jgi:hypothetical protein
LEKNLNYNLEEQVQNTIIELALETENSLRHLEIKIQDTYRYFGAKGIEKITKSGTKINTNIWRKRQTCFQEV